jgi:hypothetical protein
VHRLIYARTVRSWSRITLRFSTNSRAFPVNSLLAGNFAPRRVRSRLARQPRSPVSGVLFPGGGESPTFPQVRLGCPSLWPAISGISVRVGRVSGPGLCWRFSNFHFGGAETGSIADRERFAGRPSEPGARRRKQRSPIAQRRRISMSPALAKALPYSWAEQERAILRTARLSEPLEKKGVQQNGQRPMAVAPSGAMTTSLREKSNRSPLSSLRSCQIRGAP